MEHIERAAELTWDKLWIYTVLMLIILTFIKGSRFIDAKIELMKAEAELRLGEAKNMQLYRDSKSK